MPLLAVAAIAVTAVVLVRDSGSPSRRPAQTTSSAPLAGLQAGRRYITIGTTNRQQFTDAEFEDIAAHYDVVLFAKFHAGWDVALHHEATRRLKQLSPDLRVYAYMSTKYWFDANDWDGAEPDADWFLRDDRGELVQVTRETYDPEGKDLGTYVDVANPDYRAWLLGVARSWMAAAPYDGIRFDAADPIGDFGDRDVAKWERLLTPARIASYNEGLRSLLADFEKELSPAPVLFNGISPGPIRGPGRDLDLLELTDGAMNETFCLTGEGELLDVPADVEIMEQHANKLLHLRAPLPAGDLSAAERGRLQRLCLGSFLLGWQPGSTFFNMGRGYGTEQLAQQPPDVDIDLGSPTGPMTRAGGALGRRFEHGAVFVNPSSTAVDVELPATLVRVVAGAAAGTYDGIYTIPPEDAVLFLDPSRMETPQ